MKKTYFELINSTYPFPQDGFSLSGNHLNFYNLSLQNIIKKHGTPLKIMYLPRIGGQIKRASTLFNKAIKKHNYQGKYYYCYCTKSCHYKDVVKYTLARGAHLETSSALDIDLIFHLYKEGAVNKDIAIVHNGHKTPNYLKKIIELYNNGFENIFLVLDSISEIDILKKNIDNIKGKIKVGIRVAINQEAQAAYRTSRLGIRYSDILKFYNEKVKDIEQIELKMLHFFVDTGIKDDAYYWQEFEKAITLFVELKKVCPQLDALNIGGGFPIRSSLDFRYDYENVIDKIVGMLNAKFSEAEIEEPDIYTEFGKYTVGESGAVIFSVLQKKQQSETELWYMINNSLMSTIPDIYTIDEKFILLPINKWNSTYTNVSIGGISCDYYDFYNTEHSNKKIYLPTFENSEEDPLYIGFFHTGAYQDSLSAYGGLKHCLIPSPKLIIIDIDKNGKLIERTLRETTSQTNSLKTLGYL